MKSYTNIEQSKVLSEILPRESADMAYYFMRDSGTLVYPSPFDLDGTEVREDGMFIYLNCWSLASLLSVLPNSIYDNTNEFSQLEFTKKSIAYHDMNDEIKIGILKDNLVDACYELILKLNELKML